MGVRFPLPAPSNLFICNVLQGQEVLKARVLRYKYGTERIHFIIRYLDKLRALGDFARIALVNLIYA